MSRPTKLDNAPGDGRGTIQQPDWIQEENAYLAQQMRSIIRNPLSTNVERASAISMLEALEELV